MRTLFFQPFNYNSSVHVRWRFVSDWIISTPSIHSHSNSYDLSVFTNIARATRFKSRISCFYINSYFIILGEIGKMVGHYPFTGHFMNFRKPIGLLFHFFSFNELTYSSVIRPLLSPSDSKEIFFLFVRTSISPAMAA